MKTEKQREPEHTARPWLGPAAGEGAEEAEPGGRSAATREWRAGGAARCRRPFLRRRRLFFFLPFSPRRAWGAGAPEGESRYRNAPKTASESARRPMASLYQRFTGKINTSRSFPAPPEASRLLGGQGPEEDGAGPKPLGAQAPAAAPRERGGGGGAGGRPRFQYQARSDCDDEDVRASWGWGGGGLGANAGLQASPGETRPRRACEGLGAPSPSPTAPGSAPTKPLLARISVTAVLERVPVCSGGGPRVGGFEGSVGGAALLGCGIG